uniref:PDZ domain-containing protein n=1 Tax=Equus asinus TaxID=9793 RepID=A0A9L0K0T0_EQUAS
CLLRTRPSCASAGNRRMEVGASGYSVTGGGDQGIFVKQVLKDSSAAKLFNLREGDQLLSTTIFFDDIKYEDALKILQYSEPYKVQFKISTQQPTQPGHPRVGAVGEGAALVPGRATMTKEAKVQEEPVPQEGADQGPAPGVSGE